MAGPDDRDPPNDEPPAPPAPPSPSATSNDEPRARDVARAASTADLEDKLDPATVAQLAAWFGLPSFEELEEQRKAAMAPPEDPYAHRKELLAKIAEATDPALAGRVEGLREFGDRMLGDRLPPPMDLRLRELARLDLQFIEQRVHMTDPAEVQRPFWIDDAMKEATPQAILRDLHRPETTFSLGYPLPDPEPGLAELSREARALATASYKVRPDVQPGPIAMREAYEPVREWKRRNWAELARPVPEES